jgi:elongation factor G
MLPSSLINIAIAPISRSDQASLHAALSEMVLADASLTFNVDEESGHFVLGAMSERQLDLAVDRLRTRYKIAISVGAPQVAYHETFTKGVTVDYTHKRQAHGKGEFARVKLQLVPLDVNTPCSFSAASDLAMAAEFIDGVKKGFESVLSAGPYAGFPILGVKATLLDGAWHDEDSSEKTFEIAGRAVMREAASDGGTALLEPVMRVKISLPGSYTKDAEADIRTRRGKIINRRLDGAAAEIAATVPLVMLFKYEDNLRSLTLGQCSFEMEFSHYALLPTDPPTPPAAAMYAA